MPYAIFKIGNPRDIDNVVRDDMISRQSITTRDAKSLGLKGNHFYVKIEGASEAIKKAEALVFRLVKDLRLNQNNIEQY